MDCLEVYLRFYRPSGDVDLKSVVEYHSRINRAAEKAHLTRRSGRVLSSRNRRRYRSPSSSSESDVEVRVRRRSRSPLRTRTFKSSPPLSRPLSAPSPPPGWRGPPPPPPLPYPTPAMAAPSQNTYGFMGPPASRTPTFPQGLPSPVPFARFTELETDSAKTIADVRVSILFLEAFAD